MAAQAATRLRKFFEDRVGDHLRSVIAYEGTTYDVVYLRDDIADRYSDDELRSAVDESILDSITAPVYESVYAEDHGKLTCLVQCFEAVVELNFVIADGKGVAVAIDEAGFMDASNLVAEGRRILLEKREE